jgi:cellulose synthase/poly-beta-1,6-N-acetylglucosamine synthase-like glycosyltransferase
VNLTLANRPGRRRVDRGERGWIDAQHPDSMSLRPRSTILQAGVDLMFLLGMVFTGAFCWIAGREIVRHVAAISEPGGSVIHELPIILVAVVSIIFSLRWLVLQVMVIRCYYRSFGKKVPHVDNWPLVSIMVPAHNEAPSIRATVRSLLAIDYPNFEVLVIDDGSKDETAEMARAFEGRHGPAVCRVLKKPNGGKWSAHNFGLQYALGEFVLCVDADCSFAPNALRMMVRHMVDNEVGAVAGNGIVRNLNGLLPFCQGMEYIYANAAFRIPQSESGAVLCVPGPIGLFRRTALDEVHAKYGELPPDAPTGHYSGPFQHDSFAEDFDLSIALLACGWKIIYEPRAVCYTEVPETLPGLISQRYRWTRGNLQVLTKLRRAYGGTESRQGKRMLRWMVCTYFVEMSCCFLFNHAFLVLTVGLLLGSSANAGFLTTYWLINLAQRGLFSAISLILHRERFRQILAWPVYEFYSSILLGGAMVIATIDQFRGTKMGWGREHRPGS